MTRRDSYLGGHTTITLHPRAYEDALVEQAIECRQQAQEDQARFDEEHKQELHDRANLAYWTRSSDRRAKQHVAHWYCEQLAELERECHLHPHPRILRPMLVKQIELLERYLRVTNNKPKVARRLRDVRRRLVHVDEALTKVGRG